MTRLWARAERFVQEAVRARQVLLVPQTSECVHACKLRSRNGQDGDAVDPVGGEDVVCCGRTKLVQARHADVIHTGVGTVTFDEVLGVEEGNELVAHVRIVHRHEQIVQRVGRPLFAQLVSPWLPSSHHRAHECAPAKVGHVRRTQKDPAKDSQARVVAANPSRSRHRRQRSAHLVKAQHMSPVAAVAALQVRFDAPQQVAPVQAHLERALRPLGYVWVRGRPSRASSAACARPRATRRPERRRSLATESTCRYDSTARVRHSGGPCAPVRRRLARHPFLPRGGRAHRPAPHKGTMAVTRKACSLFSRPSPSIDTPMPCARRVATASPNVPKCARRCNAYVPSGATNESSASAARRDHARVTPFSPASPPTPGLGTGTCTHCSPK